EGIRECTPEFRNACSHSIVVALFAEKGQQGLNDIMRVCRMAPGGPGAYTMCFHGLGHGIVAALDYDMPAAIGVCKQTGTAEHGDEETRECVGGIVMEMISGGFHNREDWQKKRAEYFSVAEPLRPCADDFMPRAYRWWCYVYLTPHLFEAAGADIGSPSATNFKKAFEFCDRIPRTDEREWKACFGGFGKEFVVLAVRRDIRAVGALTDAEARQVGVWCGLAPHQEGAKECVAHAVSSLFWGGENTADAAIGFCGVAVAGELSDWCFQVLTDLVSYYAKDSSYRGAVCARMPPNRQARCRSVLLGS
ncbi:MAG: hypothetical protein AAB539_04770, partial [Patescibacteria group bacterium]